MPQSLLPGRGAWVVTGTSLNNPLPLPLLFSQQVLAHQGASRLVEVTVTASTIPSFCGSPWWELWPMGHHCRTASLLAV